MSSRITLCNPTSGNWDDFIRENARIAVENATARKDNPKDVLVKEGGRLFRRREYWPRMAEKNDRIGYDLYICGAGPSLRDHYEEHLSIAAMKGKCEVWGTNSAVTWLKEQGAHVTHAFGIDQTDGLTTEWSSCPDVKYYVASTVNPNTVRMVLNAGRQILWFHNFVGTPTEQNLYRTLWPASVMVGDGLNSANRALCLGVFMGFKRIWLLGADCAMKRVGPDDYELHANRDGATAHGSTSVIMTNTGPIAGHPPGTFYTKPDMLFSAVALARNAVTRQGLTLVGDTLPHALLDEAYAQKAMRPGEWLDRVARLERMTGVGGMPGGETPKGRNMASDLFTVAAS